MRLFIRFNRKAIHIFIEITLNNWFLKLSIYMTNVHILVQKKKNQQI